MMQERDSRVQPIQEDMAFQRRSWAVERVAWVVLGLLVCAALFGTFAQGPLSNRTIAATDQSVTLRYERFQRNTRATSFHISLAAGGPQTTLRLSPSFQDTYEVTGMQPAPEHSSAGPDGLDLTFAAPHGGGVAVLMWAHPHAAGFKSFAVSADGKSPIDFSVLIYP